MEGLTDLKEFELALQARQHREVLEMMNKILQEILKEKEPSSTEVNVEVDTSKIEKIIETINTAPDFSEIPNSIKAMNKVLEKHFKAMKFPEPVKKWKHTVKRDSQGLYSEIISEAIK